MDRAIEERNPVIIPGFCPRPARWAEAALAGFLDRLANDPPPLAQIQAIDVADLEPHGEAQFAIRDSSGEGDQFLLVPPDIATCEDCRRDFTDPATPKTTRPCASCASASTAATSRSP